MKYGYKTMKSFFILFAILSCIVIAYTVMVAISLKPTSKEEIVYVDVVVDNVGDYDKEDFSSCIIRVEGEHPVLLLQSPKITDVSLLDGIKAGDTLKIGFLRKEYDRNWNGDPRQSIVPIYVSMGEAEIISFESNRAAEVQYARTVVGGCIAVLAAFVLITVLFLVKFMSIRKKQFDAVNSEDAG